MRSVEIFAGCGGLALGVAEAGFSHSLVVERDPAAAATLLANKKRRVRHVVDWKIVQQDIRDVRYHKLSGRIALLSGGPPCQPFSIGGNHRGPKDSRNMMPEAIRAVCELRPKAFLLENVRGLLRPAFGSYLELVRLQLSWPQMTTRYGETFRESLRRLSHREKMGRTPSYRVLIGAIDAADYGTPQRRHRAIIMGVRSDCTAGLDFPRATHTREALLWDQWVTGRYWDRHKIPASRRPAFRERDRRIVERMRCERVRPVERPWVTVRDAIGDLPIPRIDAEPVINHRLHPGARVYPRHTGSSWDEPSKTLKAGAHGVPGGENMLAALDGTVRYFTVREMARLQGLPDTFALSEGWKEATRQLGNAVPVQIGRVFGRALAEIIGAGEQ